MSTNGGGPPAPGGGGSKRLAQQQAQVDEVVDIMRQNVDKVLERDKNLSLLDDRADKLQHNAAQFEQHAGKLKRKFWWKNMKIVIYLEYEYICLFIYYLAWIASKVKAVAPALPAGDVVAAAPSPSVTEVVQKPAGGSVVLLDTGKPARKGRKKKKTTVKIISTTPAPVNDGERSSKGKNNNDDDDDDDEDNNTKSRTKRFIRALIQQ
ncbi:unnamed protein product [Adineta steineri]|uniref:V-SNARE coiled-coil homology domain-containing protein n=1 Tax=Adineta steineri TaxID=433720 RepID=A0A819LBU7_9BILA|nr:unnamed protein product [Adineta steineri]